jgi:hypothetical protein
MRNSLALLGIPDLPIYAFRHVGDRRIQPQGGGGGIINAIIEAPGKAVESISNTLADVDDTVNKEVPGGWATVVNIATAGQAAPYTSAAQAAVALDKGASLEDVAKNYVISSIASEAGGAVGAETGSKFAGNVAGGTTAGLLSGKSLEESVKGGVISGGVSQVTPSTLLSSTPSGTTGTQEYIPESNIGQSTPSSTSGFYTGQGTTGANNMADYYTNDYENYGSQQPDTQQYPEYYRTTIAPDYGNPEDYGVNPDGMMRPDINYGSPEDYGVNPDGMPPPSAFSSFDAATQAYLRRLFAAGGSAAQAARNFLGQKGVIQGGLGAIGSLRQIEADKQAAIRAQENLARATQQGVAGSQFRPVGTTTRFGTSQFQTDPITGQIISAGYTAAPEITSAQNRLMSLGSSYLAQTPEEVAQQYMTRQYDLLDPSRQRQLASIRNQQFQTGRGGLSVGSTGLRPSGAQGLMGSNPELEAYYNVLAQQDAQLAAQAQEAGQRQVSFGTGLFGQAGQLETMAQQPFTLSQGLAEKSSIGGYRAGDIGYRGAAASGAIGRLPTATTNPYATVLGGFADPRSLLSQGLGTYLNAAQTDANIARGNAFMVGSDYSV